MTETQDLELQVNSQAAVIEKQKEQLEHYKSENIYLTEVIRKLQKEAFGPKRERWESEEQYRLFNEAEVEAKKDPESEEPSEESEDKKDSDSIKVKGYTKKRGKRSPLPKNLEREVVVVDLPEEERVDENGNPLKVIGKEVSEKLSYRPAEMKVIEYHRLRYGRESGDPEKTAPPVPNIVPKGIATPSLLAAIVVSKYGDGLPLYRQEEIFSRHGIDLKRATMGRWVLRAAEACRPIWNVLEERLMSSSYMSCDETPVQVLGEDGRKNESKSWMWVRCNPSEEKKIILYDYDPRRTKGVAERLFSEYEGALQVDGYASYDCLEKNENLLRLGCNMHGRRKFHEARTCGAKKGQGLAGEGLDFYRRLYDVETLARQRELDATGRYRLRQEESVPIWEEFFEWAKKKEKVTPPKSKIGMAFGYFLREYQYLTAYLKDGCYEMDNGFVERAIKYFAMGRKAWLFAGSPDGARASELFYSLIITARLNGVNTYRAMEHLFEQIPLAKSIEDYERLAEVLLAPQ